MFDFFYGSDSEQYQFYRVPQVLFTDDRFKSISCEAKLLYGFLICFVFADASIFSKRYSI